MTTDGAQPEVGRGHLVRLDAGGVALLGRVIDLFSRRVIGWAVGDRLHRELALAALRKALVMRRPPKG